ncbi:MAG TPA: ATP-binding protein [Gemmatimonadales bacterium]|nr:ATP-binding protein [Gemmatimonadales bacterium]
MSALEPPSRIDSAALALPGGGAMGQRIRDTDWSGTPLGPITEWPQSLRTAVGICTESRFPMAIWWGAEAVQLYNDGYVPVLGAKHPHSLGQSGMECWAEIWDVVGPLYSQVMKHGRSTWSDDLLLMMDRHGYLEETYFTFSYSPIRDESGGVGGLLITCAETTERVVGERRLRTLRDLGSRSSEARTVRGACELAAATLAENPLDVPRAAIYLLEPDGTVAVRAGGAGDLSDFPPIVPLSALDADASALPLRQAVESGGPIVQRGAGADGLAAETIVLPVPGAARSAPIGLLVAVASARRRLDDAYRGFFELIAGHAATAISSARGYEDAERRAETLAELDRAKTTFFSNVSHEFRTPLTLLLGPLEDALGDATAPLADGQRERVEVAHRNGLRLLRLVNTLLDFTRLEAGRSDASFDPIDLSALTAELASGFRSAAERAGLRFVVECVPLTVPVYVDQDMWEKIVLNLLSNALKFTSDGEITVRLSAEADTVRLEVRDTGVGIPEDALPRIFERFHRVRDSRGRTQEGTGIGLALVEQLVRLHGGEVEATSVLGEGSTFRVTLPAGREHLPADQIGTGRGRPSGAIGPAAYLAEALRWVPAPAGLTTGRQGPRIVVADDNADMRDFVVRLLGEGWRVEAVSDGRHALAAIRREVPDLVISDVMMPGLDGFGLLEALRGDPLTRTVPVILLSARAGEEARVEGLRAGADDYLVKPFAARELLARVEGMLALARVRREAEVSLRESQERYRAFIELTSEAVWRVELERPVPTTIAAEAQIDRFYRYGYLAECNDAMAHMYGYGTASEITGARLGDLLPREDDANLRYLRAFIDSGYRLADAESHEVGRDGRSRWFVNNLFGVVQEEHLVRAWGSQRDVTERRLSLERLQQAQRMESVGKLAGGIAHEVNNMMSVVLGCSDFVLRRSDLPPAVRSDVEQVREAAQRSAAITAQLLAFSRRQMLQPVSLDPNSVVRELQPVLQRTLGETVTLELRLASTAPILADRGQLQQVLLNLALNARDAIAGGGRVIIETRHAELGERDAAEHPEIRLRLGAYVLLTMTDTGHGMDAQTVSRIFEPFFTTKGVGKGTGLGLSTVYGIVKQSEGYVWADSELGRGTTFRVYLPVSDAPIAPPAPEPVPPAPRVGETVLVVDDEALVRSMAVRALQEEGFEVLAADSGAAALSLLERDGDRVRLVVTDVAMAGIGGRELGHRLLEARPNLPVLYMSGYPADEVIRRGLLHEHEAFLQKPFAPSVLAAAVRGLIEAKSPSAAQE